jgi:hypothetical protein
MATHATAGELLKRLGVDPAGADADGDELQHNRWLSPGVWRIRTRNGQRAVLKYAQVGRPRAGRCCSTRAGRGRRSTSRMTSAFSRSAGPAWPR